MTDQAALMALLAAATSIAALHTVIGVDHSLPFIVLGKARGWSLRRVLTLTALCGVGHVSSSLVIGGFGLGLGVAVERLASLETGRGGLAAWLLIAFGVLYATRAVWRERHGRRHSHVHAHADGVVHSHVHDHTHAEHRHPHESPSAASGTAWALFIIFVLGPCEPLIPLLMAPAAMRHLEWAVLVGVVFGLVTIGAMLAVVTVGYLGLSRLRAAAFARHADALAGAAIAGSGIAIQTLGL